MTENSIRVLLKHARQMLTPISDSPTLDAELLLAHCIDKDRAYLHTWPENQPESEQRNCFQTLLEKRLKDIPVAYLLGKQAFWTLNLIVTEDVLIPRPETELLVETALELIEGTDQPRILDMGTGTGAIALALACERPDAFIIACDNSPKALSIARKNAEIHGLTDKVSMVLSDWFSEIDGKNFDLIVSNPPYIDPGDAHLSGSIRHEPQSALVSADNGMSDIQTIIKNSSAFLKPAGWLILEHGYQQGEAVCIELQKHGFRSSQTRLDYADNPRVSLGQKDS